MKTFLELINEQDISSEEIILLQESLQSEWNEELESKVDSALEEFVLQYGKEDGTFDFDRFNEEITNEGFLGSIMGGLTGFALGKTIGKTIAKVLGIEKGIFYNLLTSRLVGAGLGAAIGKSF
jgi:hypothetical protein